MHLVSAPGSSSTGPSGAVSKTLCLTRSCPACQRTPCTQQAHRSHPAPPTPCCSLELRWGFIFVVQSLSHVQLFVTPWTAARQASLSSTISWSLLKLKTIESVIRGFGGSLNSGQYDSLGLPYERRPLTTPTPLLPRQGRVGQQCCSTDATRPPDPQATSHAQCRLCCEVAREKPCVAAPGSSEVLIQGLHSCQAGPPRPHRQPLLPEESCPGSGYGRHVPPGSTKAK